MSATLLVTASALALAAVPSMGGRRVAWVEADDDIRDAEVVATSERPPVGPAAAYDWRRPAPARRWSL